MKRAIILLGICWIGTAWTGPFAAVRAQTNAPPVVEIATRDGKVTATLAMPMDTTGKVPVVVLLAGSGENIAGGMRSLAMVLARDGIASLRYNRRVVSAATQTDPGFEAEVADAAACVSFLRNDIRFSTITVAAHGDASAIGTIAARIARADTSTSLAELDTTTVTKVVRDLDLPGVVHPRRNTGQRASLRDTTIATIDGSRIGIEYGRPSKRGRVIWGTLVKWGGWWMPGADEATTLTTHDTLEFGTLVVQKGDYTLYTEPGESSLALIINSETGQFHTVYNATRDLGRVTTTMEAMSTPSERLTFAVEPRAGGGGVLKLIWDDRAYLAPFVVRK